MQSHIQVTDILGHSDSRRLSGGTSSVHSRQARARRSRIIISCKNVQNVCSHTPCFLQELDARRLALTTLFGGALISEPTSCLSAYVTDPIQITPLNLRPDGCAAPVGHYWYRSLDMLFLQKCRWPQASAHFVLSKVRLHFQTHPLLNVCLKSAGA